MENPKLEHIDDLLVQLFCDVITNKELTELKEWIDLSPENKKYVLDQQEIWFSAATATELAKYDKEKAFERFLEHINSTRKHHIFNLRKILKYAAAIVVIFIIGYASYRLGQNEISKQFADIEIVVPKGAQTRTLLPDGTVVWLNADSRLSYSQGFGMKDRNVKLNGEGYFEVAKNMNKPFHVESSSMRVNVIGTKFNFRDYPDEEQSEVTLSEGCVVLDNLVNISESDQINPGQRAVLNKRTGEMVLNECDASDATTWTSGHLVLNGEPLALVAKK